MEFGGVVGRPGAVTRPEFGGVHVNLIMNSTNSLYFVYGTMLDTGNENAIFLTAKLFISRKRAQLKNVVRALKLSGAAVVIR